MCVRVLVCGVKHNFITESFMTTTMQSSDNVIKVKYKMCLIYIDICM